LQWPEVVKARFRKMTLISFFGNFHLHRRKQMLVDSMRIILDNAHMKRRINLTIDAKLIAQARNIAHQRKSSISNLVEQGLQTLSKSPDRHDLSFAERWAGKLRLAPRDPADRKRERLWRKYRLVSNENSYRH
jgi:hypothetical protein